MCIDDEYQEYDKRFPFPIQYDYVGNLQGESSPKVLGEYSVSETTSSQGDDQYSRSAIACALCTIKGIKKELSRIYFAICIIGGAIGMAIIMAAAIVNI